jgi:predicted permease
MVWLEQVWQDARFGVRSLWRNPGFAVVVMATLALGVGMNTAVLSLVNSVLLRALPYPGAARLVWLSDFDYLYDHRDNYVSRPAYLAWKALARSFERMMAYGNQDLAMVVDGVASQERVVSVAGDFWAISGARAQYGRLFGAAEDHTIVLSHALFERRFGANPAAIGRAVSMNGHSFTIVGVLPAGFRFLFPPQFANGDEVRGMDAYIAIPDAAMRAAELSVRPWEAALEGFGPAPYNLRVVAKLRPAFSLEQGRAEMETIYANVKRGYPDFRSKHVRLGFSSLEEKLGGESRRSLLVLLGAAAFVLLIACANTASLLLARASARAREIAIRAAVGAGRARMVRQFLTESVVLSLCGGAAGLLVAAGALTCLLAFRHWRPKPRSIPAY